MTIAPGDLGDVSTLRVYMTDPLLNLNDPNNNSSGLGGALLADLDVSSLNSSGVNGTGILVPQTDTSASSFAGNYAFGAQVDNDFHGAHFGWEFDFIGQGLVSGDALSAASGLLSDPFFAFNSTPPSGTDTGVRFSGTASTDLANPGRYTLRLGITISTGAVNFPSAIYQASGGQLFWLDEDENGESVFLGLIEQQGALSGLPAARRARATTKARQKP